MARTKLIAANWKMNKTIGEAISFIKEFKKLVKGVEKEILICPPFTALSPVSAELKSSEIKLGAQNLYFEDNGAFTSEISAEMLKEIGCSYVIIGHSERRHIFNETDDMINKKVKQALKNKITPILCVGEKLEQREAGDTETVIEQQIKDGLKGVKGEIVIAYEPVWAIGTGKTATSEQAEEAHVFIRGLLQEMFNEKVANSIRILYGGSVKPENAKELMSMENIDGALVGGASLDAKKFFDIINF
jgi:triosephosphate isomerase